MTVSVSQKKWICQVCGYIYDPSEGDVSGGINKGTGFENLPDDWCCPDCGAEKSQFNSLEEE